MIYACFSFLNSISAQFFAHADKAFFASSCYFSFKF